MFMPFFVLKAKFMFSNSLNYVLVRGDNMYNHVSVCLLTLINYRIWVFLKSKDMMKSCYMVT